MEPIVSSHDSGSLDRGQHHQSGDLLVADLREHETPTTLTPVLIQQQTRILDEEFLALLAASEPTTDPATCDDPTTDASASVIPGFEALTWADLAEARRIGDLLDREFPTDEPAEERPGCPPWCLYADTDIHTDGYDDPATNGHVGVRHLIRLTNGGATFGNPAAPATVAVQLEQDRHRRHGPAIVFTVDIDDTEHEAYLTPTEARTLHHALATLLRDAGQAS